MHVDVSFASHMVLLASRGKKKEFRRNARQVTALCPLYERRVHDNGGGICVPFLEQM